jgi:predicted metal-dependent hydrolase
MKNKWASCSTSGHLNFNDELIGIEKSLGEYVIVHELLHFRTPNHGPLWKSYMSAYLPQWETLDKRLKKVTQRELSV